MSDSRAFELILWGRALDRKYTTIKEQRALNNSVYRKTLREERLDLHDDEANGLMRHLFLDWFSGKSTVTVIDLRI